MIIYQETFTLCCIGIFQRNCINSPEWKKKTTYIYKLCNICLFHPSHNWFLGKEDPFCTSELNIITQQEAFFTKNVSGKYLPLTELWRPSTFICYLEVSYFFELLACFPGQSTCFSQACFFESQLESECAYLPWFCLHVKCLQTAFSNYVHLDTLSLGFEAISKLLSVISL